MVDQGQRDLTAEPVGPRASSALVVLAALAALVRSVWRAEWVAPAAVGAGCGALVALVASVAPEA